MNAILPKTLFFLFLFMLLVSLACANSAPATPTPAPTEPTSAHATQTPVPTLVPTEPPTATLLPPTVTATNIPPSPVPDILDFRQWYGVILTFDPVSPGTLYTRGISDIFGYQSADGGMTWQPEQPRQDDLPRAQFLDMGIYQVRQDPHTPTTLYGINEALQSFVKSVDGGVTWTPFATPFHVFADKIWEIDPQNPGTLFASDVLKVYKSADGGETWREIMSGIPSPAPSGFWQQRFIFDPSQLNTVYFLDGGMHGLYKSTNNGESWVSLNDSQGQNSFYARWLVIDPLDSNILHAINGIDSQLYTSPDGGQTWQPTDLGLSTLEVYAFAIDPLNPSIHYAILPSGETSGLFKSTDSGQTWMEIETALLP